MLKNKDAKVILHGFLSAVEAEEGVNVEYLGEKLAGALTFVEGVGKVMVEHLGEIEEVKDEVPDGVELMKEEMN